MGKQQPLQVLHSRENLYIVVLQETNSIMYNNKMIMCTLSLVIKLVSLVYSFQLQTVQNLTEKTEQYVFVRATLYHGTDTLPKVESITTKKMPIKSIILGNEKFKFSIQIKYLPRVRYLQLISACCFCTWPC